MKTKPGFTMLFAMLLTVLFFVNAGFAEDYSIAQLSNNGVDNLSLQVDNGQATWETSDNRILFYDGATTIELTDNARLYYMGAAPALSNGQVVWIDGTNYQVYLWDGTTTRQISDNAGICSNPKISNGQVVWRVEIGYGSGEYDIYLYDGVNVKQIASNVWAPYPEISNGQVVWTTIVSGVGSLLYLYDGSAVVQLDDPDCDNLSNPTIENGKIVCTGWDGHDYEVIFYDGSQFVQLTNNDSDDTGAIMHNGQVAWSGYDGQDDEIFLFDGMQTIQLTNNNYPDSICGLQNGQVAWLGRENPLSPQVFVYNGIRTIQLTDNQNSKSTAQLSGNQIVWEENTGRWNIFLATPREGWPFVTGRDIRCSPVVGDINNDGNLEIIFSSMDNNLYCVDINGRLIWKYANISVYGLSKPSVIADIDKDGNSEIIVGSDDGYLYCINKDGNMIWKYQANSEISASPAIADINNDGTLEIIFGAWNGQLYCIDKDGNLIWSYQANSAISTSPAIGNINGDDKLEIIFGTARFNNTLYCVNDTGTLIWTFKPYGTIENSPTIADLDKDGTPEVLIAARDNLLYCLDKDGNIIWTYLSPWFYSTPSVADINKDGYLEILGGAYEGYFYCITHDGQLLWEYKTDSSIISSPAIADLDNDGNLEILIGSTDKYFYCISNEGQLRWKYETGNSIYSSAAVADLDNNGFLEILFASMDHNFYCLDMNGQIFTPSQTQGLIGAMPWPMPYHDLQHTGLYALPNQPPVLSFIGDKEVNEGELLSFTIGATDTDSTGVKSYYAENLPAGAEFDSQTHIFTWAPTYEQAGKYTNIKFIASDDFIFDEEIISVNVNNTNRAPTISQISDQTMNAGGTLTLKITATDADGDPIKISSPNLPSFATLTDNKDGTASISLKPVSTDGGIYSGLKVIAADSNAASSEIMFNLTVNNNSQPDITIDKICYSPSKPTTRFPVVFVAEVRNIGTRETGCFTIEGWIDGQRINSSTMFSIKAGRQMAKIFFWSKATKGTHVFKIIADPGNKIPELQENNNEKSISLTVR